MAGRPGRSGGARSNGGLLPLEPTRPAPPLDGTVESNKLYCAWVAEQLSGGHVDPRTADAMLAAARTEQGAIRVAHGLNELEQLRTMVKNMESAVSQRVNREKADRYVATSATTSTTLGRVKVPDGDKH